MTNPSFAQMLQDFFLKRLINQRNVSPQTVSAYKDTFRLLLNFIRKQSYHIEHNFGHGKNHLSFNFFLLNLLAFFMHQIFELSNRLYQKCREEFSSKEEFWNNLRSIIRFLVLPDWETLLQRVLEPSGFL